jgi:hypothetical protein
MASLIGMRPKTTNIMATAKASIAQPLSMPASSSSGTCSSANGRKMPRSVMRSMSCPTRSCAIAAIV